MRAKKKAPEPSGDAGAPEWMVTFSDCMTLLLTFFVLLLSFSTFDDTVYRNFKVIYAEGLVSIEKTTGGKDAVVSMDMVLEIEDYDQGSEKPTLEKGKQNNLKEEQNLNYHEYKVFLRSSSDIFWGNGRIISTEGEKVLSDMAALLREMPNRIAVSENSNQSDQDLGLHRAWAVIDYLTTEHKLDKKRFSISAANLTDRQHGEQGAERTLEVVLLERRIYN
ncbi:flagellar motor protein MotB [Planctomycetota bacterium]